MSAETTKVTTRRVRKATFLTEQSKGQEVFRPVNKRAHALLGRKKRVSRDDLKALAKKSKGKVGVYVYTSVGLRKAVR